MISQADGKIIIELDLEDDEFNRNLGQAENNTKNFGGTIKNLLATFGLLKAGSAVFGLLRDSIGSAMGRLDTMAQYNRVMTAMTGSNTLATKSLEEVNEAVKGTAYGLDVAAHSTQKFVTSGMDISKATGQVKIWGDAVAFYGKGTNESYSNVTDALSKMVSKGKIDMEQMNRLTEEGIPAVQIYADYTGQSMSSVQEALSNGTISATQFMDTMSLALNNGSDKFKGISGAAKEAGSSWTGTIDNMKAAVTRGMTDLITNVDKGMEKAGLGSLKDNISSFGKTMEKVLADVGGKIPGVIKLLSDLKGPIIALGVTTTGMKLAKPITDTYNGLKVLKGGLSDVLALTKSDRSISTLSEALRMSGKEAGASGKMLTSLGGVVGSLPFAAAAVGVGALVVGFVMWKQHLDNSPTQKLKRELDETIKSMNDMQDATDKQIEASASEANYYSSLRDELSDIVDVNGKVKEGYEDRASFITGTLNDAYGTEITMIDGVIQGYQEQMTTIDNLMAKQRAQSAIEAYKDDYDEALKKQKDYNEKYGELAAERTKREETYQKEFSKAKKAGLDDLAAHTQAQTKILKEGYEIDDTSYNKARQRMVTNNTLIDKIEKAKTAMSQGNYAEVENILSAHSYNIANLNKQSIDELNDNIGEAQALHEANLTMSQEYASKGDELNAEKYQKKAEQYAQDLIQMQGALDAQNGVLSEKSEGYRIAMSNYQDAGLQGAWGKAQSFSEVGQLLIQSLANGADMAAIEGVGSVQRVGDTMVATINGMDYIFNSSGQLLGSSMTMGLNTGFEANQDKIYDKSGNISKAAIDEYVKGDWVGSGSKAVLKIAEGTEINGNMVKKKMEIAKDGTVRVWDDKEGKYKAAGKAVCDGINLGIDAGDGFVVTAFGNVARGGLKEFKRVLGIKSPSSVMGDMAGFTIQGYTNRMDKDSSIANKSMGDMARGVISTAKKIFTENTLDMNIPSLNNAIDTSRSRQNVNVLSTSTMKQIVEHKIDVSEMPNMIDYERLAESCANINFNLDIDKRSFGRVVKEVK